MKIALLVLIVILFAASMGGSGMAPSFAASYCSKLIKRYTATFLFSVFVILGAVLLGNNVTKTLGSRIIPREYIDINIVIIILFSALLGLFIANIFKVPQSTSWATVFSIYGSGLAIGRVEFRNLLLIIPMWVILPVIAYFVTLFFHKKIYPPGFHNLWIYGKMLNNERTLRKISIYCACYVAFSIGSNNVANVVGPISGAGLVSNTIAAFIIIGFFFGIGALVHGKNTMCTIGQDIVPLGITSASIVNFTTATLLVFASILGVPQSIVQLNTASILAISHNKNGFLQTTANKNTKKIFLVWIISPLIAFTVSFILARVIK